MNPRITVLKRVWCIFLLSQKCSTLSMRVFVNKTDVAFLSRPHAQFCFIRKRMHIWPQTGPRLLYPSAIFDRSSKSYSVEHTKVCLYFVAFLLNCTLDASGDGMFVKKVMAKRCVKSLQYKRNKLPPKKICCYKCWLLFNRHALYYVDHTRFQRADIIFVDIIEMS